MTHRRWSSSQSPQGAAEINRVARTSSTEQATLPPPFLSIAGMRRRHMAVDYADDNAMAQDQPGECHARPDTVYGADYGPPP